MPFCGKCGTQVQDGVKFCPSCGMSLQTQSQVNDAEANKIMAVISYIGVLVLIPLITGKYKQSPFLKFHVNQAIIFCIGYFVVMLLYLIPSIGGFLGFIIQVGILVMGIISIIGAIKGETRSFPIINKIKIIK